MLGAIISLICVNILLLGSPGPAPLSLAATGATCGVKKGTPFLFGIVLGLAVAFVGTAVGLAALFAAYPKMRLTIQILGGLYIIYIAFKIATAPVAGQRKTAYSSSIPRFYDGLILNLLNPKAYAVCLVIFSQFMLPFKEVLLGFIITGIICLLVATVVDFIWLGFGGVLRPIFEKPKPARIMHVTFAALMVLAVVFVLIVG
jgi:threonine/homoserine/homoserine lactone efflux protein